MCVACCSCLGVNSVWDHGVTLFGGLQRAFVVIKGCFSQRAVLPIAQFEKHLYLW